MSVVVWDGQTLAADQRLTAGERFYTVPGCKIWRAADALCAVTGDIAAGAVMRRWWSEGADLDKFPASQAAADRWCRLIVVPLTRLHVLTYEQEPVPLVWPFDKPDAWGSGRDFALGALACGANARQAVAAAIALCITCGGDPDALGIDDEPF